MGKTIVCKRVVSKSINLLIMFVSLVAGVFYLQRDNVFFLISEATGKEASLVVIAGSDLGEIRKPWQYFSQGGEDLESNLLALASEKIASLSAQGIRIDHIYDGYGVVSRTDEGGLKFSWERLDKVVDVITGVGAVPMFSLSYMPPVLTEGEIVDAPRDWSEWALVVQKTVEHYSGELGIKGASYEVWNEPDLFGKWSTAGEKNYLTLYLWAVKGAEAAEAVHEFQIGGPAITSADRHFLADFINYVEKNRLRLNFVSWHRYSKNVEDFDKDADIVMGVMADYPGLLQRRLPLYITEAGPTGELDAFYDQMQGAAQAVASVRAVMDQVARIYTFELVDGKDPRGREFWGRWGFLTHPDFGLREKPRYQAFRMLNRLEGKRLLLLGEGTWVKAIASKNKKGEIVLVAVNYSRSGRHNEEVELAIKDLKQGKYLLKKELLGGGIRQEAWEVGVNEELKTTLSMPASGVMLVQLQEL